MLKMEKNFSALYNITVVNCSRSRVFKIAQS